MSKPLLETNFGDDEESDTEFNPGVTRGSDDEGSENGDAKPIRTNDRRPRDQVDSKDNSPPAPRPLSRDRKSNEAEEVKEDEDEEDGNGDNGEDDEGEGEDLNGEDEEDEDEDDEEDEEDEDAVTGRPRKRRRHRLNQFFEEEAEVDEDDDELENDEDDIAETGFIQDTHPDDDLGPEADQDDRRHRELDRQRQLEASLDAEKQAQRLKERYGRRTATALSSSSFVPQNLLMPSVDDPSIWGIKCKPGKEKEIVWKIMKKFMESKNTRQAMRICSAFERGNGPMAGYVFVEARRKVDVDEALNNIPDVYPRSKTNLVPVKEMPDLLRVTKTKELEIGGYVRIKRGIYQGDLGMIHDVESNGLDVTVRVVPRLNYGLDEDDRPGAAAENKRKRMNAFGAVTNLATRPPARLFNENEAKKRHHRFLQSNRSLTGRSWTYKNEIYEDGFLIKDYKLQHLMTEDVNPKLDEITKLTKTAADGSETLDLETLAHSLRNATAEGSYMPGDEVEVYEGEQKGIVGRTENVSGTILSIRVSEGELTGQVVEVPVKGVRKRFREGDHVKIIGGSRYRDEVGMVIRIKDDRVTVLTDTSMQEVTVFSKDLREAADTGGGGDSRSNLFDVQDLVQLDATTVGIVTKSDRESVRILDQNGSVTTRLPSQIQRLEARKNAVATDRNGAEIRPGDVIREAGGENKTGSILHIHRGYVFTHNKTQIENSGLWVARCMNIITTAAKGRMNAASATDLTKLNPALKMQNGGSGMGPPQKMGRDRILGQHVHIRKGPYKGHRGICKDTTASTARIELQSKNKVVNIDKQDLMIIDRNSGKMTEFSSFVGASRGPPGMRSGPGGSASRVPDGSFGGGRTPFALGDGGGRTPAWDQSKGRTPAWGGGSGMDSGRTPAWKPASGSQTSYGGAGGSTTYGGAGNYGSNGGQTPAWNLGARTPYGNDHGFSSNGNSGSDAFATGSRTPYGAGASHRTPAWGGPGSNIASAPTPAARPYDAPTPAISAPTPGGGGFNNHDDGYTPYGAGAPTPGAGFGPGPADDAPTPGFAKNANREPLKNNRLDAPTPGASMSAMTPYGGGYDAPTPAAGGPRYADDDDED